VAELAAARRLSTRDTLVRSASTIEALGRTDVLCCDKTGTLTEGRISLHTTAWGAVRPTGSHRRCAGSSPRPRSRVPRSGGGPQARP
jgi:P-type E1-E2 ATPase